MMTLAVIMLATLHTLQKYVPVSDRGVVSLTSQSPLLLSVHQALAFPLWAKCDIPPLHAQLYQVLLLPLCL